MDKLVLKIEIWAIQLPNGWTGVRRQRSYFKPCRTHSAWFELSACQYALWGGCSAAGVGYRKQGGPGARSHGLIIKRSPVQTAPPLHRRANRVKCQKRISEFIRVRLAAHSECQAKRKKKKNTGVPARCQTHASNALPIPVCQHCVRIFENIFQEKKKSHQKVGSRESRVKLKWTQTGQS